MHVYVSMINGIEAGVLNKMLHVTIDKDFRSYTQIWSFV